MAQQHPARAGFPHASPAAPAADAGAKAPGLIEHEGWTAQSWREAGMPDIEAHRLANIDDAASALGSIIELLSADDGQHELQRATDKPAAWRLSANDRANLFAGARLLARKVVADLDEVREQLSAEQSRAARRRTGGAA